jgi:hypothetical protein
MQSKVVRQIRRWTILLGIILPLAQAEQAMAKTICLMNNFAHYFVLRGGKIDKRPYVGREILLSGCVKPVYATATRTGSGEVMLAIYTFHSPVEVGCTSETYVVMGDEDFNATGRYDTDGGPSDGDVTFSRVDCSTVP